MPRAKVKVELIQSPARRKNVYRKRRQGLTLKASQLATLCGVDVLLICFGPSEGITMWPSDADAARGLIDRYRNLKSKGKAKEADTSSYLFGEIQKNSKRISKLPTEEGIIQDLEQTLDMVQRRIALLKADQSLSVDDEANSCNFLLDFPLLIDPCLTYNAEADSGNFLLEPIDPMNYDPSLTYNSEAINPASYDEVDSCPTYNAEADSGNFLREPIDPLNYDPSLTYNAVAIDPASVLWESSALPLDQNVDLSSFHLEPSYPMNTNPRTGPSFFWKYSVPMPFSNNVFFPGNNRNHLLLCNPGSVVNGDSSVASYNLLPPPDMDFSNDNTCSCSAGAAACDSCRSSNHGR